MKGIEKGIGLLITETAGFDPESTRQEGLQRTIEELMRKTGIRDEKGFLDLLKSHPGNMDLLLEDLVVPETWFFRDSEPFRLFEEIARQHAATGRVFRVLSVPCATGEEAYSIAMILMSLGLSPDRFVIDAVDISRRAIDKAKEARYGKRSFRENSWQQHTNRWFTCVEDQLVLDRNVVARVSFKIDNLVRSDFRFQRATYDVIFCRNLVIYLSESARENVVSNLRDLLKATGTLFVGHSEMLFFCRKGFDPVPHPRAFACRKDESANRKPLPAERAQPAASPSPPPTIPAPAAPLSRPAGAPVGDSPALNPAPGEPPRSDEHLARVKDLADRGRLLDAENECRNILIKNTMCAATYCLLGTICAAKGDLKEAESAFQRAVYLNPECYEALVQLSLIREQQGDVSNAQRFRERARRSFNRVQA